MSRSDKMARQPHHADGSSSRLIARRRTGLFSCQPVARTNGIAITPCAAGFHRDEYAHHRAEQQPGGQRERGAGMAA